MLDGHFIETSGHLQMQHTLVSSLPIDPASVVWSMRSIKVVGFLHLCLRGHARSTSQATGFGMFLDVNS